MSYLTRQDELTFGPELLDVATRAAHHAVGPQLQELRDENQQLRDEVGRAAKNTIDQYLDANVPGWRQINNDPSFHQWLLTPDPYSGVIRDRLLKEAAAQANTPRVASFFTGYLAAAGQAPAGQAPARTAARRRQTPSGQPIYTRSQIEQMWNRRRQGKIDDAAWMRWEHELIAAGREGRIIGALDIDGVPVSR